MPPRSWIVALILLAGCCLPLGEVFAQAPAPAAPKPQLSDKVAEEVGKLQTTLAEAQAASEAKDPKAWDAAIEGMNRVHALCVSGTYDDFYISKMQAQLLVTRAAPGDFAAAIPAIERMVTSTFFDKDKEGEFVFLLAQLYLQLNQLDKAEDWARRYLQLGLKLTVERVVFYCSLLMQRADKGPGTPIDRSAVQEALKRANEGLRLSQRADDRLLLILAVGNIALEDFEAAAEALELLVKLYPKSRQYWPQLYSLYVNMGRDLRAALTIERAQELGLMNTSREFNALVGIYYNLGRYEKAIELLEKGLADGTLESTERNYETLAYSYQQSYREMKAMDVYKRASEIFTDTGKYDMLVADMYFKMDDNKNALVWAKKAFARGGLDRPVPVGLFITFLAYEAGDFAEAAEYLGKVKPLLETERDVTDYGNLRRAVFQAYLSLAQTAQNEKRHADAAAALAQLVPLIASESDTHDYEDLKKAVDQALEAAAQLEARQQREAREQR